MCSPVICAAQSEWEAPTTAKKETKEVKTPKKEPKAVSAQAAATTQVAAKNVKDWEYIKEGAVPVVNGKVTYTHDISLPGKSAQQIYDLAYAALDSLAKEKNQINSSIALINRKEHSIVARYQEWMEFSKSFISLDRTKFSYVLMANCTDNKLHLSMERLSYTYEEDRPTGFKTTAENLITDKNAVNKKRTKLVPGMAKFRKKTIDPQKEIFKTIEAAVSNTKN